MSPKHDSRSISDHVTLIKENGKKEQSLVDMLSSRPGDHPTGVCPTCVGLEKKGGIESLWVSANH